MQNLGSYVGITLQAEVIILIIFGICCSLFDASVLDLTTNLKQIWALNFSNTIMPHTSQLTVKYILSSIVLVKTFSVHLYLAFYIVMLWPAIFVSNSLNNLSTFT